MMEAFSKASEYCEVDLCVKASNLEESKQCSTFGAQGGESGKDGRRGKDVPGEGDFDVLLVDRKPEIQQLELAVVSV